MSDIIHGFEPIFDGNSQVLILGSFPSVKSREINFYYGNKQNRFWKMLCNYFNVSLLESVEEKKSFVLKHGIALWDIVTECEIIGSQDSKIKNYKIADVLSLILKTKIKAILINGKMAFKIFCEKYKDISTPYYLMPSTSPANPRYKQDVWHNILDMVFGGE